MEALAARVAHLARQQRRLSYFDPVADTPGFARALASTILEMRLAGVDPLALESAGKPGEDLAAMLRLYGNELAQGSLADLAELFQMATEVARTGSHRLLGLPLLLLDVPLECEAHRRFAAALEAQSPAAFCVALAEAPKDFGVAAETTLNRLRRQLFSSETRETKPLEDNFEFFSAPGEGLESIEIARRILGWAGQGVPFDEMAVLLHSAERYQPLIEEALRRAGIPGWFSRGSARPDPAGRAFLALLACASEGCSASRFAEYLSLGQVPALDASGAPARSDTGWVTPDDEVLAAIAGPPSEVVPGPEDGSTLNVPFGWEKLLVDAAVIGGRERWARRLQGLENEFRLRLSSLGEEGAQREQLELGLERLGRLERFALPLIDLLGAFPQRASWGEWLEHLDRLAGTALRHPESVLAVLSDLRPMADVGPVDIDEVYGVLAERLRFVRREPPARPHGRVFVGSIEEARGRAFRIVFLPGLAEGLFPRRAFEDPLLLDESRRALPNALALREDRVARERMLLRAAAAAAGERFVVSYPRMDTAQSRPRVPSFYAMETVRAAEGNLPGLRRFEQRAMQAAPSRLGWPAPRDPREAIDEAEYDLALFEQIRGLAPDEAKGAGRYLIEANPHLTRSLRTRWRRSSRKWTPADGIVDPDAAALAALQEFRLAAHPYSPSALQHFSACPYRFALHGIHRLRPREEPVALEEMDPLTRGALFHTAVFEILRELETTSVDQIWEITDRVLDRVAARYADDLAPAIPRVWESEVEDLRTDLRGWAREFRQSWAEWEPLRYEFAFGLPLGEGRDPRSIAADAVILDGARIRGSMDLLERHRTRGVLRVTDHKTGKAPDRIPLYVGGGALLQPLLYALAAEQLLGEQVESGRLFYCTQRGNYTEMPIQLTDRAREFMAMAAGLIDQSIRDGFLPAAPQADACDLCDYRAVCGPDEPRCTAVKPADRLETLQELRGIP
jgi:RecB family exonuclease